MKHLLLLHGAIGSSEQLQKLKDTLSDEFIVHSINFSGHGGIPLPSDAFSIALFAADVISWMDTHSISHIAIFGYSMGGYVALYLAKHHPDRIAKIFTLATKFSWTPEIAAQEIKMLNAEKIEEKIPAFAETLKKRHLANDWKIVLAKTIEMMLELGNKNALTDNDYCCIEIPVILSIGDNDKMVSLNETSAVNKLLKNSELLLLPNTSHPIETINVSLLSQHIRSFFKD